MKFRMYSPTHYAIMFVPLIIVILFILVMQNRSKSKQELIGKIMAVCLVLTLVVRNIYNGLHGDSLSDLIPLQMCHLSGLIIVPGALYFKNRYLSLLAITMSLPAGYLSLVFADSLVNYGSLFEVGAVCYVILHALITIGALYVAFVYRPLLRMKDFSISYGILVVFYLLTIVINNIFIAHGDNSTYFYSVIPEPGTPLETMNNWGTSVHLLGLTFNPVYIVCLLALATVIMLTMFGLYKLFVRNKEEAFTQKNRKISFAQA